MSVMTKSTSSLFISRLSSLISSHQFNAKNISDLFSNISTVQSQFAVSFSVFFVSRSMTTVYLFLFVLLN